MRLPVTLPHGNFATLSCIENLHCLHRNKTLNSRLPYKILSGFSSYLVTSPHKRNCGVRSRGERCERVHGVNKEVCWGVGGGQGSCGKRYGGMGGDVGKCVGVWGEVRKDVWGVEKCGEGVGKCMG